MPDRRRRALIGALLLGSALVSGLGACGFRPLLYREHGGDIQAELAAIRVAGLNGRLGQLLRNALLDDLDPTSTGAAERYVLAVNLQRDTKALAIQLDNSISRYNLELTAIFQLRDAADGRVIYRSSVRRIASYNQRRAPFATLTAEKDAERRAAEEISNDIRTLLAVHFQRQASVV
jgi:LPS-assembly lipoprotein